MRFLFTLGVFVLVSGLLSPAGVRAQRSPALSAGSSQSASTLSYDGPRTSDGRPDLSGIWQVLSTAAWDIRAHNAQDGIPAGLSVVVGGEIPYQPWAVAQKQENAEHWLERDPEIKCFLPGVPRATYMPYPFQIFQGTDKILIAYEFAGASRTIHMDEVGSSPSPTWMGWSRGRWEGETLVVDVTGFNGQTWFDRAGNFHSDALHVVERYTPISPNHLMYEATIEDPNVFTEAWEIRMPLYRRLESDKQLLEYECVEFVEQLMYGELGLIDPETGQRNE